MDLHELRREQRRIFLGQSFRGVGALALASIMNRSLFAVDTAPASGQPKTDRWPGVVHPLHFTAKAKRVIWLCMAGGPSHLETFDSKPKLSAMSGKPMPESFTRGKPIAQLQGKKLVCLAPQHPFQKFGKSGQEMCALFPHLGKAADDICIIRSMVT